MKLTGRCKDDFDKWYNHTDKDGSKLPSLTAWFDMCADSMKYGVYVDWFDSVDIDLDVFKSKFILKFYNTVNDVESYPFETRSEARKSAIEKANDIYNGVL